MGVDATWFGRSWGVWAIAAVLLAGAGAPTAFAQSSDLAADPAGISQITKVLGVRFGGDAATTRLVVDLDGAVSSRLVASADPANRVSIALSQVDAGNLVQGNGHGGIKSWRLRPGETGARLVLELADGEKVAHRFLLAPSLGATNWRLVVDVTRAEPVVADTATGAEPKLTHAVKSHPRALAARLVKVIVIDAGHGGHDPGAQSQTHNEKDVTLAAALALKSRLERSGRYKVVLTRSSDVFVPLETRVQIARKAGADLFLSLHADSAGADPTTHGASIYTLSDHGETRVNTVLGSHEWFNNTSRRSDPAVGQILLDLTQNSTRNRSSVFAGLLVEHLSDRVDLLPRTHRDAGYFVLLAPDVPAALLEMGFISNPTDEARLTDAAQRRRLMDGVAAAIDGYFAAPTELAAQS